MIFVTNFQDRLPSNIQANAPYLFESHLYNSPILFVQKKWVIWVSLYFTATFSALKKVRVGERLNKSDHFSQQLGTLP